MELTQPRAVNHISVGVDDVNAGVAWYRDVMGFRLFRGPVELTFDNDPRGQLVDVLGPSFRRLLIAHMTTGNGVGFEIFQSVDPPHKRRELAIEFWRSGLGHFCITDPNIEALTARIVASGGRQLSRIWNDHPPSDDFRMVYCQDPFGTVIEIYTHSYEVFRGVN